MQDKQILPKIEIVPLKKAVVNTIKEESKESFETSKNDWNSASNSNSQTTSQTSSRKQTRVNMPYTIKISQDILE